MRAYINLSQTMYKVMCAIITIKCNRYCTTKDNVDDKAGLDDDFTTHDKQCSFLQPLVTVDDSFLG